MRIPSADLAGTPEGILTLRALKAEPMNELLIDALWDESLLFSLSESALERVLRYILDAQRQLPELRERIRSLHTQPLKQKAMTLADRLREEGKLEGKREAVLRALEIRHGRYPEGIREALERVDDPSFLEKLHESAFRSNSVEEFAQGL